MGQAREVMDRLTSAMTARDKETQAACYAADAVAVTPDQGEITGQCHRNQHRTAALAIRRKPACNGQKHQGEKLRRSARRGWPNQTARILL